MCIADFVRDVECGGVQRDGTIEVAALPRNIRTHDMAVPQPDAVSDLTGELFGSLDRLECAIVFGVILVRACDPPHHGHLSWRIAGAFQFHERTGVHLACGVARAAAFVRLSRRDQRLD